MHEDNALGKGEKVVFQKINNLIFRQGQNNQKAKLLKFHDWRSNSINSEQKYKNSENSHTNSF